MPVGGQKWTVAGEVSGLFPGPNKAKRAIGAMGGAARSLIGGAAEAAKATREAAAHRVEQGRLRKEVDQLQEELDKKIPHEVGTQLLNNNVRVPGASACSSPSRT